MDCHVATALVTCVMECRVPGGWPGRELVCVLFLPHDADAVVTHVSVESVQREKVFTTMVVPNSQVRAHAGDGERGEGEL